MKNPIKRNKRRHLSPMDRSNRFGWIFCLPFILGMVFIFADVIVDSLKFGFSNIEMGNSGYSLSFVGFEHFKFALTVDADFIPSLVNSVLSFVGNVPITVLFSIFIATMLNQNMKGRTVFRALFFVPVVLVTGIATMAESGNLVMESYQSMSGVNSGAGTTYALDISNLQNMLANLNAGEGIVNYVVNLVNNIYNVVNQSGVQIILFLAGLQSISPAIYEAAHIEGAKGWEIFWKITLPMISPIVLVNCLYTAIDIFTSTTNPIMSLITSAANSSYDYGTASAMAWLYFLVVCVFLVLISLLGKRFVFHQEN